MKRAFEFRLSRIKRLRETEEKVARAIWALAERRALDAAEEQSGVRAELARSREQLIDEAAPGSALQPGRTLLSLRAIDGLLRLLRDRKERAATLRLQADDQARAWRERDQRRRAMVELEGRRRIRHRRELERAENAERDEIASMRAAQKRRAQGIARRSPGRGFSAAAGDADPRPGSPSSPAEDQCPSC
jgi:hypothetical protein